MEKILVVDHEKCTGCRLCEMVCSVEHTGVNSPGRSRIHIIKWPLEGFDLPMLCQQCEEAPCIAVCPKDALSRDSSLGRVVLDYDLCIGCKCDGDPTCVRFCDPGALQFVPITSVHLRKKRDAGQKLSEVMKKAFASRF